MEEISLNGLSGLSLNNLGNLKAKPDSYVGLFCISSYPTSIIIFGLTATFFPSVLVIEGFSIFVKSLKDIPSDFSFIPVPTFPISRNLSPFLQAIVNEDNQELLFPSPHCAPTITKSSGSSACFSLH